VTLALAPMEGVADDILREVLTSFGGWDFSVTEFVRVTGTLLPAKVFRRISPELANGGRTTSGTPVRVQLLGSDPVMLAANAERLATLEPPGIDLNFGCPAPTVNRHRGGAALLREPELLESIVRSVRSSVRPEIPVTAKMRLGIDDTSRALDCALALQAGGARSIVVHGRTKVDGYRPPAKWDWIARIAETLEIPVFANGDVWTVADFHGIRAVTGCADVMVGRGAVSDPFLARRIRGAHAEAPTADEFLLLAPALWAFWDAVLDKLEEHHASGRLKMWLRYLGRTWPVAAELLTELRTCADVASVEPVLSRSIGPRPVTSAPRGSGAVGSSGEGARRLGGEVDPEDGPAPA